LDVVWIYERVSIGVAKPARVRGIPVPLVLIVFCSERSASCSGDRRDVMFQTLPPSELRRSTPPVAAEVVGDTSALWNHFIITTQAINPRTKAEIIRTTVFYANENALERESPPGYL